MAAIIAERSRNFSKIYKAIPKKDFEVKYYNSTENERSVIFTEMITANMIITYVCVDKQEQADTFQYGNDLYKNTLEKLIKQSLELLSSNDVDIKIDGSRFIAIKDLMAMVENISNDLNKNVKNCKKVHSTADKCVKIADFVAGSIWTSYEKKDARYFNMIEKKISMPANHLGHVKRNR
jgi:hypothetical protein